MACRPARPAETGTGRTSAAAPLPGRRRWTGEGWSGTMSPPRRTTAKAGGAALEATHPAWPGSGNQAVELGDDPVPLGEVVSVDHGGCPFGPGGGARGSVPHQGRPAGGRLASAKSPVGSPVGSPVTGERGSWA